jgi:hypothetical protein
MYSTVLSFLLMRLTDSFTTAAGFIKGTPQKPHASEIFLSANVPTHSGLALQSGLARVFNGAKLPLDAAN